MEKRAEMQAETNVTEQPANKPGKSATAGDAAGVAEPRPETVATAGDAAGATETGPETVATAGDTAGVAEPRPETVAAAGGAADAAEPRPETVAADEPGDGSNSGSGDEPGAGLDHAPGAGSKNKGPAPKVDGRIVHFLRRHHVLTLATAAEDAPYCANAFYCYDAERNLLIFTSELSTRHARQMERNPEVAASVVLETRIVGRIRGLQICGTVQRADEAARRAYLKRFPYAALAELTLWALAPHYLKFTDNTLGFGKKLIWNKQ